MARGGRRRGGGRGDAEPAVDAAASGALTIHWGEASQRDWDGWMSDTGRSVLEQSWAYGDALALASPYVPLRAVVRSGRTPIALAQTLAWRVAGAFTLAKVIRGPLFLEPVAPAVQSEAIGLVTSRWRLAKRELLLLSPELPEGPEADALMRGLGMRRTVTGYSSLWLDLGQDDATLRRGLHPKWRNQLATAEAARVRVQTAHGGAALEWLLARHDEHRRKRRFRAPAGAFVRAIVQCSRDRHAAIVLTAMSGSESLAGALFLRHGRAATYYVGWTGEKGRAVNAHNLLLWQGLLALKERGVAWLDLGGVDGLAMPGVSRFKLGLGGELFTLAGTYV
jgi:hypothetical protein